MPSPPALLIVIFSDHEPHLESWISDYHIRYVIYETCCFEWSSSSFYSSISIFYIDYTISILLLWHTANILLTSNFLIWMYITYLVSSVSSLFHRKTHLYCYSLDSHFIWVYLSSHAFSFSSFSQLHNLLNIVCLSFCFWGGFTISCTMLWIIRIP